MIVKIFFILSLLQMTFGQQGPSWQGGALNARNQAPAKRSGPGPALGKQPKKKDTKNQGGEDDEIDYELNKTAVALQDALVAIEAGKKAAKARNERREKLNKQFEGILPGIRRQSGSTNNKRQANASRERRNSRKSYQHRQQGMHNMRRGLEWIGKALKL